MIGCHTSRRSHTVGVSHVARAGLRGLIGEPSILRGMASEHGKIERSSTSHRVAVIDILCPPLKL
jgi:hypothetical protein